MHIAVTVFPMYEFVSGMTIPVPVIVRKRVLAFETKATTSHKTDIYPVQTKAEGFPSKTTSQFRLCKKRTRLFSTWFGK
jgi:hypothetical protein